MIFFDMLYHIFIYPIIYLLEVLFYFFGVYTLSSSMDTLFFVSIAINIMALPLYNIADKLKEKEDDIQKVLKPKIDDIKAVYKSDKAYMLIRAYYKVNGYKTIYAFRSSLGLLIQIPLFLAAYNFFSSLDIFSATSFMGISNMAESDKLLQLESGTTINVLPFVMTFFSLLSTFIHTKGESFKKSISLYAMSLFFLVFLYNSPAVLLVYWTINCAFSFVKNVIIYNKEAILSFKNKLVANKKFIKILKVSILVLFLVYTIVIVVITSMHFLSYRIHTKTYTDLLIIWFTLMLTFLIQKYASNIINKLQLEAKLRFNIFLLSSILLTILVGLFVPSALVGSSAQEFQTPYRLIFINFSIYIGIFFVYGLGLYSILPNRFKSVMTFFISSLSLLAILNVFIFPSDYGVIDADFFFSNVSYIKTNLFEMVLNIILVLSIFFIILLSYKFNKTKILSYSLLITIITLVSLSVYEFTKINRDLNQLNFIDEYSKVNEDKDHIFNFSKTGENILIIILDRGSGIFLSEAFNRLPSLKDGFDGFTFYTNTISLSHSTFPGVQTIYGGYEYAPYEIYKSGTNYNAKKINNEALIVMPKLFSDIGYGVTTVNPVYANFSSIPDISIFAPYTNVNAYLTYNLGKIQNKAKELVDSELLESGKTNSTDSGYNEYKLSRFTLFRMLPTSLRNTFYSDGDWVIPNVNAIMKGQLRGVRNSFFEYAVLLSMEEMSSIKESNNYFNMIHNDITHEPAGFSSNYKASMNALRVPEEDLEYFFTEFSARSYYSHVASFEVLGEYFNFLKENDVYDNTKIIIVSDHADVAFVTMNNNSAELTDLRGLNALFLVKDFNSKGALKVDGEFMSVGDVPYLATKHLKEPKNPFTGKIITDDYKQDGVNVVKLTKWHPSPTYKIKKSFHVKDNIFDTNNWTRLEE